MFNFLSKEKCIIIYDVSLPSKRSEHQKKQAIFPKKVYLKPQEIKWHQLKTIKDLTRVLK